jgi:hypothetical protein
MTDIDVDLEDPETVSLWMAVGDLVPRRVGSNRRPDGAAH